MIFCVFFVTLQPKLYEVRLIMIVNTEAIVLKAFKYGENKTIVDLFTRANGRMSFITPLSKSGNRRSKKPKFQPLTMLNASYELRPRVALQKFGDVSISTPFVSIPFNPYKLSIALFVAEFLSHALRAQQTDETLFLYITNSLQWLDGCGDSEFANFHLVFLMRLSRFLGFFPYIEDYSEGDFFDLRTGCFTKTLPLHGDALSAEESSKVGLMMRMNFSTMHLFRMSHNERNRLLDIVVRYYKIHIPDFPDLKSIDVLRGLFA